MSNRAASSRLPLTRIKYTHTHNCPGGGTPVKSGGRNHRCESTQQGRRCRSALVFTPATGCQAVSGDSGLITRGRKGSRELPQAHSFALTGNAAPAHRADKRPACQQRPPRPSASSAGQTRQRQQTEAADPPASPASKPAACHYPERKWLANCVIVHESVLSEAAQLPTWGEAPEGDFQIRPGLVKGRSVGTENWGQRPSKQLQTCSEHTERMKWQPQQRIPRQRATSSSN